MEGRGCRGSGMSVSKARRTGEGKGRTVVLDGQKGDAGLCEGMAASLPESGSSWGGRRPASTQVLEDLESFLCKSRLHLLGWPFSHKTLPGGLCSSQGLSSAWHRLREADGWGGDPREQRGKPLT